MKKFNNNIDPQLKKRLKNKVTNFKEFRCIKSQTLELKKKLLKYIENF